MAGTGDLRAHSDAHMSNDANLAAITAEILEGIRDISVLDIKFAGQLGYTIKLLGIIKQLDHQRLAMEAAKNKSPIISSCLITI